MSFDLITFGCSWTRGVGVGYQEGDTLDQYNSYRDDQDICDKYAFRKILAERWGCTNINFAVMGSSNQRQFRRALEHFNYKPERKTIVLWFITSIFRHEVWVNERKGYCNVLYGHARNLFNPLKWKEDPTWKRAKVNINHHIEYHFDEDHEIKVLCDQMDHWNLFFDGLGIENYWIDTLNHHNYPYVNPRMLFNHRPKRDLLSMLVQDNIEDTYHQSQFSDKDSRRISTAVKLGLVNPYSYHPTKETHIKIADLIDEEINHHK